ncbi:MAG: Imm27 family immunity protein [Nitrososphaera sp.]|nr:Imm27 family immunity protein [Nitrososphaera sp.]
MKTLRPHETDLVGDWIVSGTQVEGDETCKRIKWLMGEKLQEVTTDASGWDVLYRDPEDGRYWELTYPQSHMHGGGPPRLTNLPLEQAKAKYGDAI